MKGLVRAYQQEIDRLSSAIKTQEAAYLELLHPFIDAPSPAVAMKEAVSAALASTSASETQGVTVQQLRLDNDKLRRELSEYQKEFLEVQSQEVTIRALEDRLRHHELLKEHEVIPSPSPSPFPPSLTLPRWLDCREGGGACASGHGGAAAERGARARAARATSTSPRPQGVRPRVSSSPPLSASSL